jgi:hypothetical protein
MSTSQQGAEAASLSAVPEPPRRARNPPDAVDFLRKDHRRIEKLFRAFEEGEAGAGSLEAALAICEAVACHWDMEQRVLQPALLSVTQDLQRQHDATVDQAACLALIEVIREHGDDGHLAARMKVLDQMMGNHVLQQERRDGTFALARASTLDLVKLRERLRATKFFLEKGYPPPPRRRQRSRSG